jgi:hypothetical protein
MIAWYPQEMVAPPELTAVKVPKGDLLRRDWVNALADRVMWLALKEEDPLEAANQACRKLGLPEVDNANQVGESLVTGNLDLLTNLNVAQRKNQFPARVREESQPAKEALESVSLAEWVELASSQVSVSDLV